MDLVQLPLADVAAACREETGKFQRGETSRNEFCWEIMRRAICERDHAAWDAAMGQYSGIVVTWVRQHSGSAAFQEGNVRARRAVEIESLDRVGDGDATTDVEAIAMGEMAGHELWQVIAEEVPDETERLVVYWSFALGLKPGEIHERSPERYPSVADVYRIKRNVLDRLRRSQRLRQLAA
jgi:hypothetical protein